MRIVITKNTDSTIRYIADAFSKCKEQLIIDCYISRDIERYFTHERITINRFVEKKQFSIVNTQLHKNRILIANDIFINRADTEELAIMTSFISCN